eukprot:2479575-Pyramimonas_sp.AAC.1
MIGPTPALVDAPRENDKMQSGGQLSTAVSPSRPWGSAMAAKSRFRNKRCYLARRACEFQLAP